MEPIEASRALLIASAVGPMRMAFGRARRVLVSSSGESNPQLACNRTGRVMHVRVTTGQAVLIVKIGKGAPQKSDLGMSGQGTEQFALLPEESLYAALSPGNAIGTKVLLVSETVVL